MSVSEADHGAGAPDPHRRTSAREHRSRWPGLVWAFPLAALLVVGYLGLQALAHSGTDVTVTFSSAADAKPGDTQVIYKGLSVGRVTRVRLAQDRAHVDMTLRIDSSAKPLLRKGTLFWLVGAKPSLTDISSLKAALAGVSIGIAPGDGPPARKFEGLGEPPVVVPGTPGTAYDLLSSVAGGGRPGASVFYHGQDVGRVTEQTLRGQNDFSTRVFIQSPYDRLVRRGTLFYGVSAVQVSFSGGQLSTQLSPGSSAFAGGLEFDTPAEALDGPRAAPLAHFPVFESKGKALGAPRGPQVFYQAAFTEGVGDLEVGAPVRLRGFQIGSVSARTLQFDAATGLLSTPVTLAIEPGRLDPRGAYLDPAADVSPQTDRAVSRLVGEGYRLRLAQSPPLVGARTVEFVRVRGAPPAGLEGARGPLAFPSLPVTASGDVDSLMAKADAILGQVQRVPIAEIGADVRRITARLDKLLSSPKITASLDHLESTLDQIDATVKETRPRIGPLIDKLNSAADQVQGVATSANALVTTDGSTSDASLPGALRQLTDAARSLRSLADYLTRHPEAILRGKKDSR